MWAFFIALLCTFYLGICKTLELNSKIIGGYRVTSRSNFAYQVSLRFKDVHFCGGVLLDDLHVLTAAHCVVDKHKSHLSAVLGDLNVRISSKNTIKINIDKITWHAGYNNVSFANDIAILKLNSKAKISPFVKPIQIWNYTGYPESTTRCSISGWGSTNSSSSEISSVLMAANIYPIDQSTCNNFYGGNILTGMICAVDRGKDSCQGDSGGPLVCKNKLVGLVSFGIECASPYFPGVYSM